MIKTYINKLCNILIIYIDIPFLHNILFLVEVDFQKIYLIPIVSVESNYYILGNVIWRNKFSIFSVVSVVQVRNGRTITIVKSLTNVDNRDGSAQNCFQIR